MERNYTLWIMGICVVLFVIQMVVPGFTEAFLLDQNKPLEIWRFITSMFLHGDITHILYNMLALFMFGLALEKFVGGKRFLIIYFASGIVANLIAINFYQSSLGASGAIFGIIGALVIIRPSLTVWAFGMPMPILVAGVLWAVVDMIGVFSPSNIANIAHLSGMGIGLLLGAFYRNWNEKPTPKYRIEFDEGSVQAWEDRYIR